MALNIKECDVLDNLLLISCHKLLAMNNQNSVNLNLVDIIVLFQAGYLYLWNPCLHGE